jgi:hypothetical protein
LAAAPKVPPDLESGSANRGVPGGSKDESAKRSTGDDGDEEDEEEGDEEEDEA